MATLGQVGHANVLPDLLQALWDEDEDVRQAARQAMVAILKQVSDATAISNLLQFLQDRDKNVRQAAAEALGRVGDASVVPDLLQALRDRERDVRWAAVDALEQVADISVVPDLIQALRNGRWDVRVTATEALRRLAPTLEKSSTLHRLISALWWRLTDASEWVANNAWVAIEQAVQQLVIVSAANQPAADLRLTTAQTRLNWWTNWGALLTIAGLALIGLGQSVISNILAEWLGDYFLAGNGWFIVLVGLALLLGGIGILLQRWWEQQS